MLGFEHERAYLFELHAPLLRRTAVSRSGFNRCASMPGALPEQLTACRHTRDACRRSSDDLSPRCRREAEMRNLDFYRP